MFNSYKEGLFLKRNDVNWNYEPSNCSWGLKEEQNLNRQNTVKIKIGEEYFSIKELALLHGLKEFTIYDRLKRGVEGADLILKKDDFKNRKKK
jgi:hypothetical protein